MRGHLNKVCFLLCHQATAAIPLPRRAAAAAPHHAPSDRRAAAACEGTPRHAMPCRAYPRRSRTRTGAMPPRHHLPPRRSGPRQVEPPRHHRHLITMTRTPQEPPRLKHHGRRTASSSPTPATGVKRRFRLLRSWRRLSCRRSPGAPRRRRAVPPPRRRHRRPPRSASRRPRCAPRPSWSPRRAAERPRGWPPTPLGCKLRLLTLLYFCLALAELCSVRAWP